MTIFRNFWNMAAFGKTSLYFDVILFLSISILVDGYAIKDEKSSENELLDLLRGEAGDKMPEELDVTFALDDQLINLNLLKNKNIPANAPVFLGEYGEISEWKQPEGKEFATYSDANNRASIVVEMKEENGQTIKNYRGSVSFDGNHYLVEPFGGSRQKSSSADERLVNIDGIDHVMTEERAELDFEDSARLLENDLDKRFLELEEEYMMPRAGFQKYIVDMFLVLDYALYNRWHTVSKAKDEAGKKTDAIQNLQYYFSHVANGVDMRYKNIKESDFSLGVRLVGYYVATTVADSPWTEKAGVKVMYQELGYSNMYKALNLLEAWIPEVMPKLGVTFDQATLFSGNNLFDGDYRPDGSPSAKSGLAEIESICKLSKPRALAASVNRELGVYSSIQTAAHELAHNLGAQHDGSGNGCVGKDQYVMASAPRVLDKSNFDNPFKFSSCSVAYFRKYLTAVTKTGKNCLLTPSPSPSVVAPANFKPLPGNQYSVDLQCQNIYGPKSYYCAGTVNDEKICELMVCYVPWKKDCQASAEQRAFDGTMCGKNKWCMNGKCISDTKAPNGPDKCIYGDFKAPLGFDAQTKMTCEEMGKQQAYRCYEAHVTKQCCETCVKIIDKKKPANCEYGDRDPNYCKTRTAKNFCYDPAFTKTCCEHCARVKENTPGCEYGDKAAWCSTTTASACYESEASCCQTCKKFKQNIPGCQYGDKAAWCATMTLSKALCDHGNTRTMCCSSCKKFPRDTAEDGDAGCTDQADWCATIFPGWCNDPKTETTCCKFCKDHKTGGSNCPYGDRYNWCKKEYCSTKATECCSSCA